MNESDRRTLDAENSLHIALQSIEQGLQDLDRFKKASDSLDRASQNSTEILSALMDASRLLTKASDNLSDQSLAAFESKLGQVNESIQSLPESFKSSFDQTEVLINKQLVHAQRMKEKQEVALDELKNELTESIAVNSAELRVLKSLVISGSLIVIAVLGYGFFKLGVLG